MSPLYLKIKPVSPTWLYCTVHTTKITWNYFSRDRNIFYNNNLPVKIWQIPRLCFLTLQQSQKDWYSCSQYLMSWVIGIGNFTENLDRTPKWIAHKWTNWGCVSLNGIFTGSKWIFPCCFRVIFLYGFFSNFNVISQLGWWSTSPVLRESTWARRDGWVVKALLYFGRCPWSK